MKDHKVLIQNMTLSVFSEQQYKEHSGDMDQTCYHCSNKVNDNDIVVTIGIGDNPTVIHNECFKYNLGFMTLHCLEQLINDTQNDENYHYPRERKNFYTTEIS